MKILLLNSILRTSEKNVISDTESIKDCMIYNLGLGFVKLGHEVTLVAASEYKPLEEEQYEFEVVFIPSVLKTLFLPSVLPFQPGVWRFIKNNRQKFDIIISSEVFAFPSLFAALLAPSKTVVWQEMTRHQRKFRKIPSKIWYNVILPVFMRRLKAIVPRSGQAYGFISRYSGNVSKVIVDHGVNTDLFRFSALKKRQLICVARLVPGKNINNIIEKFAGLLQMAGYEDIKLLIAGSGESETMLKELVKSLKLTGSVEFLGYLPHNQLNSYVSESMALLVDTLNDLNMVSIPEAIVSGTPVVTNLVPASAQYISENQLGIAKYQWLAPELKEIIDSNRDYVNNCLNYRDKLSFTSTASKLLGLF